MAKKGFIFSKDLDIKEKTRTVSDYVKTGLMYLLGSVSLAILYYVIFALFISTDTERALKKENRMFAAQYPIMKEKEKMIAGVAEGLDIRDDAIFKEIFHSEAPSAYKIEKMDFLAAADSVKDKDITAASSRKVEELKKKASAIEDNFRQIYSKLEDKHYNAPPLLLPLDNFSYVRTGASVGMKVSPFYKVPASHNGIDLLSQAGTPVRASSDGVVSNVIHSHKGLGNVVEITHENGYVTRYAHLGDIKVSKGSKVKAGAMIGSVGMSGNTFAPHLHYEVIRDSTVLNPANHFFGSITPKEYANILLMSASSERSMD